MQHRGGLTFTCVCLAQQVALHADDMALPKKAVGNVISALSSVVEDRRVALRYTRPDVLEDAKDARSLLS